MTTNNSSAARTCIVVVVVRNESKIFYLYFPEEGNLNGNNADMFSDVPGLSSIGSGDFFELSYRSNETDPESLDLIFLLFPPLLALLAYILDLSVTSAPILPSGACYVIMHKVY